MEVTYKSRLQLRTQNIVFIALFLTAMGLLAWVSQRYNLEADWTATGRNTLSEASIKFLQRMEGEVSITAFARKSKLLPTRDHVREMIGRYQKHKTDIKLEFINPDLEPEMIRKLGISIDGELIIKYADRKEQIQSIKEEIITNALQRLLRGGEQRIVFLAGHGERSPKGQANHNLENFIRKLESQGIKASTLTLSETPQIPKDTATLVIASPQLDYLSGEVKIIREYVQQGGNLLWMHDPGSVHGLDGLAKDLGIRFVPGVIVDPTAELLGLSDPSFALVANYAAHPISKDFVFMTIYPRASGIEQTDKDTWEVTPVLQTVERSWSETGAIKNVIKYDAGSDTLGPLTLGMALTRTVDKEKNKQADAKQNDADKSGKDKEKTQRIFILGDGDFLSNAYLGNQGNQNMGHNIINWLSHDDVFIDIPAVTAPDSKITLSEMSGAIMGLFFLLGLPAVLLGAGLTIWIKRRKR